MYCIMPGASSSSEEEELVDVSSSESATSDSDDGVDTGDTVCFLYHDDVFRLDFIQNDIGKSMLDYTTKLGKLDEYKEPLSCGLGIVKQWFQSCQFYEMLFDENGNNKTDWRFEIVCYGPAKDGLVGKSAPKIQFTKNKSKTKQIMDDYKKDNAEEIFYHRAIEFFDSCFAGPDEKVSITTNV